MTEMRSRGDTTHEHHFPCDCGDWHYLSVSLDEVDSKWRFLEIADTYYPLRWRDRFKAAWKVLNGEQHCVSGVLLNKQNAEDLKEVCEWVIQHD